MSDTGSKSPIETHYDNSISPIRHATTTDKKFAGQKKNKDVLEVKYFSSNDSLILAQSKISSPI